MRPSHKLSLLALVLAAASVAKEAKALPAPLNPQHHIKYSQQIEASKSENTTPFEFLALGIVVAMAVTPMAAEEIRYAVKLNKFQAKKNLRSPS